MKRLALLAVLLTLCGILLTPASPAGADVGFNLPAKATVQMALGYKTDSAGNVVRDARGFPTAGAPTLFLIDTSVAACGSSGNSCDLAAWQKRYGPGRNTAADKFSPGERGGTLKAALGALCEAAKVSGPISLAGPRGLAQVAGATDCRATQVETADAWFAGYFNSALDAANRLDLPPGPKCEPAVCPEPKPCPSCPSCTVCAFPCPIPIDLLKMSVAFLAKCDGASASRCDWRAVRIATGVVEADNRCTRISLAPSNEFADSGVVAPIERVVKP